MKNRRIFIKYDCLDTYAHKGTLRGTVWRRGKGNSGKTEHEGIKVSGWEGEGRVGKKERGEKYSEDCIQALAFTHWAVVKGSLLQKALCFD